MIIASGRRTRALNVPGEKALIGRGVSYCATCDAPLFRDKDVAVIGSGNPALTAVNELASYAHTVYSIVRGTVKGNPVLVDRAKKKTGKVEFLSSYAVEERLEARIAWRVSSFGDWRINDGCSAAGRCLRRDRRYAH